MYLLQVTNNIYVLCVSNTSITYQYDNKEVIVFLEDKQDILI